jgi:hypothetical protein
MLRTTSGFGTCEDVTEFVEVTGEGRTADVAGGSRVENEVSFCGRGTVDHGLWARAAGGMTRRSSNPPWFLSVILETQSP